MASRQETERQQKAIQELREAITRYGREAGEAIVRERYPDVSRSTWLRWRKAVVVSPVDLAAERIREAMPTAAEVLPCAPSPAIIAKNPVEGRKALDFMAKLHELIEDAELLRDYASKPVINEAGEQVGRAVKVPTFWAQSIKLRSDLLERFIQANQLFFDFRHMQALYDAIVAEIEAESPEVAKRIMSRLAVLDQEKGFTMNGRI